MAPTDSATSNRQAEMMYLLRRYILGRNFFLRPDCVHPVPEAVRRYHSKRFREAYEAASRTAQATAVRVPAERQAARPSTRSPPK